MNYNDRFDMILNKIKEYGIYSLARNYSTDIKRVFSELFILIHNIDEMKELLPEEEYIKLNELINKSLNQLDRYYTSLLEEGMFSQSARDIEAGFTNLSGELEEYSSRYYRKHGVNRYVSVDAFNMTLPKDINDSYYDTLASAITKAYEMGVPFYSLIDNEALSSKIPLMLMKKLPQEICILRYLKTSDKEILTLLAERNYKELSSMGYGSYYVSDEFLEPFVKKDYRILIPISKKEHNIKQSIVDLAIKNMTDEQMEQLLDEVAADYQGYRQSVISKMYLKNADIAFRLYKKLDPKDHDDFFNGLSKELKTDKIFLNKCMNYSAENKKDESALNSFFIKGQNRNNADINKTFVSHYMKTKYNIDDVDSYILSNPNEFVNLISTLPYKESKALRNYCLYNPKFKKIVMNSSTLRNSLLLFTKEQEIDKEQLFKIYTIDDILIAEEKQMCSSFLKKIEVPYFRDYKEKHPEDKTPVYNFLKEFLLSKNFEAVYGNHRFNINDINYIDLILTYYDKKDAAVIKNKMREYTSKYHEIYVSIFNDIIRYQDNDEKLEQLFAKLRINRSNIYDFIFYNKYYDKNLKTALLLVAKKHYKENYISIGDIVSLIDEMATKELTIDEILKEKNIDKKNFYRILDDLSINNPQIYDYVKGELKNNQIRGLVKHIRKGKIILRTNIESREQCIKLFEMTPEEIIKSYESLDLYEDIYNKLSQFLEKDKEGGEKGLK